MPAVHMDQKNFDRLVIEEKRTALLDFWSPRCGPCRMLGPVIEAISEEVPADVLVAKVDADQEPGLAQRFGIMAIPTVIAFRDGQEVRRTVGLTSKEALLDLLK